MAYVPALDLTVEIDTLPFELETPAGSATDTAAVSFDVRGAASEMFRITIENSSGEKVGWQWDSRSRPIFRGLTQHWEWRLAPDR